VIVARAPDGPHHSYSHRSPVTLSPAEERADFERALEVFAAQGIDVRGHRAALWGASRQTPSLIAEHGLAYDSSLMGDDRPYRIVTDTVPIVELPVHWSLDDWEQYAYLPDPHIGSVIESPVKVAEMWRVELDGMRRYQCLFNLCVHPFLSGRPGRIVALRGFIEHALELGDVRFARCLDVAEDAGLDPTLAPRTVTRPAVTADVYPG
jgi:peptidoglycan/xylan/chitin deacetylase (PgdA/CDA1 family)